MNPILLVVLVLVAVVAGVWVGQQAKALSSRRPRSLSSRARDAAASRIGGFFRGLVGREAPSDDEPEA